MKPTPALSALCGLLLLLPSSGAIAQTVTVDLAPEARRQTIDGFGAFQGGALRNEAWLHELLYDDLGASIYRVDLTPNFISPYSDLHYYSPWFMGSGTDSVFNLEDPDNPNGPEGNRVRTYTGSDDYSRPFGGRNAPIAVMGPDIEQNVAYFRYPANDAIAAGYERREALGDFKLIGSIWSPAPWLKVSSGNTYGQNWWPGPVEGTPWPFVWGGNFAGGQLDVSGTPLDVFDDAALGGAGPTSSLTQFARSVAAHVRGFQRAHGVPFYAISIQNELNFEQFYNSTTYPLASQYITALKAIRTEFDKHDDLRSIRLMGPEDLLGVDAQGYGMWQYGSADDPTHKNLQYLHRMAADGEAMDAVDFFAIHGYARDGASAAGAAPTQWTWWANGWDESPAPGLPSDVKGFTAYGKRSWVTETSGEEDAWLAPSEGFPNNGGWSIALKIHQALTAGQQSAWVHWTFAEERDGRVAQEALTSPTARAEAPKYVGAKHFFRYIRPGAYRVATAVEGAPALLASAYAHEADGSLAIVLVNASPEARSATVRAPADVASYEAYTSSQGALWEPSTVGASSEGAAVEVPGYGVVTLYATGVTGLARADVPGRLRQAALGMGYPNPFRSAVTIPYTVASPTYVRLDVFDLTGRHVATLADAHRLPGAYTVRLDAGRLPAGVYVCRLRAGAATSVQMLVRVK